MIILFISFVKYNLYQIQCDYPGIEFLSLSHQDPALTDIPIIMLTSRSQEKYKQLATELGAMAYLTKPYLEEEILATINKAVSGQQSAVSRQ
ncbi:response regulator [Moorena sp. SIO3I8]|uniref:response regulator n=1 Tax=Moorena sp. SIO3I8 TaxID=2607833 RepID=UPI0025D0DC26|nr:response regulator [Moorena sp. SIO3I8]